MSVIFCIPSLLLTITLCTTGITSDNSHRNLEPLKHRSLNNVASRRNEGARGVQTEFPYLNKAFPNHPLDLTPLEAQSEEWRKLWNESVNSLNLTIDSEHHEEGFGWTKLLSDPGMVTLNDTNAQQRAIRDSTERAPAASGPTAIKAMEETSGPKSKKMKTDKK